MKKAEVLAIIPARAGSKRIPNKNIKNFLGKPLIAYTIKQALACSFISRVIVDTDSKKIARIAKKYNAEVPWLRPANLAKDSSLVVDSILHSLNRLKKEENYIPDYVAILQTTSPLREIKDIEDCWLVMQRNDVTTALTVCSTHPRLYHLKKNKNIFLVNGSENQSSNAQAWPSAYILNGCFYIVKTNALIKEKLILTKKTKAVVCPTWRSVDLDTAEDWVVAELLYKNKDRIEMRIKELGKIH